MQMTRTSEVAHTHRARRGPTAAASLVAVFLVIVLAACAAPTDVKLKNHLEHYGFAPDSLQIQTTDKTVAVSVAIMASRRDDMEATDRVAQLVWQDHGGTFAEVEVVAGNHTATYTTSELERRWGTRGAGLDQRESTGLTPLQRAAGIGSGLAALAIVGTVVIRSLSRPKTTAASSALASGDQDGPEAFVLIEDSERLESARSRKRTGLPAPGVVGATPAPAPDPPADPFDSRALVDRLAPDVLDGPLIGPDGDIRAAALTCEDVLDILAVIEEGCGYRPWLIGEWAITPGQERVPTATTVELVVKHAAFGAAVAALREVGFEASDDGSDNTVADSKGRRVHIYLVKFDNAGFGWLTSSGLFGAARSFPPTSFTVGELAGQAVLCVIPDPYLDPREAVPAEASTTSPS